MTFYSVWPVTGGGFGALKQLDPAHGELKSMRAHPDFRGRGAGKAVLPHLMGVARSGVIRGSASRPEGPNSSDLPAVSIGPTALPNALPLVTTSLMTSLFS